MDIEGYLIFGLAVCQIIWGLVLYSVVRNAVVELEKAINKKVDKGSS